MTKLHIKKPPLVRCEMTMGFAVELPRDAGFNPSTSLSEDQKDDILSMCSDAWNQMCDIYYYGDDRPPVRVFMEVLDVTEEPEYE